MNWGGFFEGGGGGGKINKSTDQQRPQSCRIFFLLPYFNSHRSLFILRAAKSINQSFNQPSFPLPPQGMAFTLQERQLLGIHGLLPPALLDQDQQVYQAMQNFYRWSNDLDRYIFMMGLQDRCEKLFYKVITENIDLMMPIIYTPTVGLACQKFGMVFRKPRSA